jgi:MFS family permease
VTAVTGGRLARLARLGRLARLARLARLGRRATARIPVLLADRPFRRYWTAQTVSLSGDQISSVAVPLAAVLVLRASAAEMGYLTALIWLPSLLFGVHAGAWVDRRGRRRATMIAADVGRFVLLASVPAGYALGVLTLAQLYAVAFAAGTLSVLYSVSDSTLFVALVPPERYVDGNSLIYASRALSFVGGPSVGGLLVQWLDRAVRDRCGCAVIPRLGAVSRPDPASRAAAGSGRERFADRGRQVHRAITGRQGFPVCARDHQLL